MECKTLQLLSMFNVRFRICVNKFNSYWSQYQYLIQSKTQAKAGHMLVKLVSNCVLHRKFELVELKFDQVLAQCNGFLTFLSRTVLLKPFKAL